MLAKERLNIFALKQLTQIFKNDLKNYQRLNASKKKNIHPLREIDIDDLNAILEKMDYENPKNLLETFEKRVLTIRAPWWKFRESDLKKFLLNRLVTVMEEVYEKTLDHAAQIIDVFESGFSIEQLVADVGRLSTLVEGHEKTIANLSNKLEIAECRNNLYSKHTDSLFSGSDETANASQSSKPTSFFS